MITNSITIDQITKKLKIIFLIFLLFSFGNSLFATTYYSGGSSAPNTLTNWWTNTNATGSNPANFTTAGDIFTIQNGHTMTTTAGWAVTGNVVINDGGALSIGAHTVTISGTTTVGGGTSGSLTISSNTNVKTFTGLVTINAGATFTSTSATGTTIVVFRGGITNNGGNNATSFAAGGVTFNTNAQALNGNTTINFANIVTVTGVTLTNNITVSIASTAAASLTGSGTWLQANGSTLNFSGATMTTLTLTASTNSNTVNYNRGNTQTVYAVTYYNLTISGGAGTQTTGGAVTVDGAFSVSAGNSFTILNGSTTTINGTFSNSGTINSSASAGGVLALAGAGTYTLPGNATGFGTTTTTAVGLVVGTASQTTAVNVTLDMTVTDLTVNKSTSTVVITNTKTLSVGLTSTAGTGSLACDGTISGAGGIMALDGGASTYSGSGSILNTGGINIGQGVLRTIGAGSSLTFAVWTQTNTSGKVTIGDGITATFLIVNGAFQAGGTTTAVTISASATLSVGATSTANLTAASGTYTVTNNGTATVSGDIVGTSASNSIWKQNAAAAVLNISGVLLSTGILNATISGNTVNYNGAAQTLKVPSANYHHITLSGSGTKTHPGGTIAVKGDWTNNGTTYDGSTNSGLVSFTGSVAQNINGTSSTTFYDLTSNNSFATSPQITLGISTSVSHTLTLTDGNITLGTYDLSLTSATGLSGGSSASYIITASTGLFKRTVSGAATYDFPLGSVSAYNPASIVWSAAPGVTRLDGKYTATTASTGTGLPVSTASCLSVTTLVDNGYWTFTNTGALSNSYDITLTRNGHTNAGTKLQDHSIVRRNNSGTAWTDPGTWAVTSGASISPANTGQIALITHTGVTAATGFGEFALAKGTNSAPVLAAISGGNTNPCYAPVGTPTTAFTNSTSGGVWSITSGTGTASIGAATGIVTGTTTGTITINYMVTTGGDCSTIVTYPYIVIDFLGGYYDYDETTTADYATQNALGHCYNNLSAGTHCFNYINPSSGSVTIGGIQDQGTAVGGGCATGSTSTAYVSDVTSGSASLGSTGVQSFYGDCAYISSFGGSIGSSLTSGGAYTTCITVPAGCSGWNYCPIIDCSSGNCSAGPLPIELLYFDAKLNGKVVDLNWGTATETNNDFYSVERTVDGKVFFSFTKVPGSGNSTSVKQYSTVDEYPFAGMSYYRLKQTDYDGKFAYSKLVPVKLNSDSPLKLMYVNPNNNDLQYQFSYTQNKSLVVQVIDLIGQTVYSQKVSSEDNGQILNIDVSGLSKGVYLLKISDGIYSEVKKFVY